MVWQEIKNIKSENEELRKFGLLVGGIVFLMGIYMWWKQGSLYPYLIIIGSLVVICGVVFPTVLLPFQKIWMSLAVVLGFLTTDVLLVVLFYIIITPIAMIMRIAGKDLLNLKFKDSHKNSYWIPRKKVLTDKTQYEKQY